ncbi:hypothetical protein FA15DRAFT_661461 [Coprinopsis marcescibilis]|uniref:Uncharacterized protein n=1 Tax=Coprinopsis marcescibilis TaxID=230819 RepID=A0A5C3KBT4_COPMA|nr:hypothetical protein FA15DRAFT_661461 [Coprinopsis marcescibilis]
MPPRPAGHFYPPGRREGAYDIEAQTPEHPIQSYDEPANSEWAQDIPGGFLDHRSEGADPVEAVANAGGPRILPTMIRALVRSICMTLRLSNKTHYQLEERIASSESHAKFQTFLNPWSSALDGPFYTESEPATPSSPQSLAVPSPVYRGSGRHSAVADIDILLLGHPEMSAAIPLPASRDQDGSNKDSEPPVHHEYRRSPPPFRANKLMLARLLLTANMTSSWAASRFNQFKTCFMRNLPNDENADELEFDPPKIEIQADSISFSYIEWPGVKMSYCPMCPLFDPSVPETELLAVHSFQPNKLHKICKYCSKAERMATIIFSTSKEPNCPKWVILHTTTMPDLMV